MFNSFNWRRFLLLICLLPILGLFFLILPNSVRAEKSEQQTKSGLPIRRVGGGTRQEGCYSGENTLTALVPENSVALTSLGFPSFLFYLPSNSTPQQLEFVLRDSNDQLVYEKTFTNNGDAGIISLTLEGEKQAQPLTTDQDYHWYFSLICDPNNRAKDIVVEGIVRRVEITSGSTKNLAELEPLKKVEFYQNTNLWHDALITLALLKAHNPSEPKISAKWNELLESVGLDYLNKAPLTEFLPDKSY